MASEDLSYLEQLRRYMNYELRGGPTEQYRVLVHDHRAVIPAIWAATQDKLFTTPPLLLRIDAHDDYVGETIDYKHEAPRIKTLEDCLLFANRLRPDDGGWVEAAIQLGLVSDVATFFVKESSIQDGHIVVKDLEGKEHNVFSLGRFRECLSSHEGELGDITHAEDNETLHKALSWDCKTGWVWMEPVNVWFDLDLDFAVHQLGGFGRMPWRPEDFVAQFGGAPGNNFAHYSHFSTAHILADAISRSKLVTIATEPLYSCGFAGVATIFQRLNEEFSEYGDWFGWNKM